MPSFDYLRQFSFYCPIPVIWSTVPVHVVQHSGKWSTVPVTSKNWTTSHRNPGPVPTGVADHFPPESVDQLRRNPHVEIEASLVLFSGPVPGRPRALNCPRVLSQRVRKAWRRC